MMWWMQLAAIGITGTAAVFDWRRGEIPNWLTLPIVPVACAIYVWSSGWLGAVWALIAAIVCGLVPILLFYQRAMGGGDVKLLVGLGAILGLNLGLETQFLAFLLGSIGALVRLAWQGRLFQTLKTSALLLTNIFRRKSDRTSPSRELLTEVRLGPAIFLATVGVLATEAWPLI